ncbi:MAG: hypothetical protein OXP69_08420 [Spirochaetaceae bacterium]|nr:hypothetical protein [Spirochaetaceae bacterium]
MILMVIAGAHPAAESAAPGAVSVTSRVEVAASGSAARTRLVYEGSWGRARLVAAVAPGGGRPLLIASGLELGGALVGPVRLAGAWRELARPLGHDAGTRVYGERTGLRPDTGISPGRLRGVQLAPLPGVAVAGYVEPAPASAGRARPATVLAAAAAVEPLPALGLEAYTAVRSGPPPPASTRWLLAAPPFPGGELALAGIRARVAAGAGELAGSVNASLGPRLPPAFHVRLSGRAPSPYGELAAAVATAGREFRALGGGAPDASLAWAARLSGAAGPRPWRVGYRFAVRGAVPRAAIHAARAGAAAEHTVELAVTPSVRLGAVTLGGEGAVQAGSAGAVPTLAVQARARAGTISMRWRGARSGDTLQVRAATAASPVAVEAGWRVASETITTQLAVEVRLPRGRLRVGAAGLGDPSPNGPRLTVTMSVER